jgi:hypothetical protein
MGNYNYDLIFLEKEEMKKFVLFVVLVFCAMSNASVVTFDDNPLPPETHWGGAGSEETGFTSGGVNFYHNDNDWSWDGFVYSNITDTATAGMNNQFSAYTGGGAGGSDNYAVSALALDWYNGYATIPTSITFSNAVTISGGYFTNTTYVAMDMLNGSFVSKKFGGATGNDADWLLLTIVGKDSLGNITGSVDFYLADYRFADNDDDYIVDSWGYIDLSGLGDVKSLEFMLSSSDTGSYGMNTPAYFAMDNLIIPEPATIILMSVSGLIISLKRRK